MLKLPRLYPFLARTLLLLEPGARRFAPIPRVALHVLRKDHLVREVVADHPFPPGDRHPVGVLFEARKDAGGVFRSRRRWVECLPAVAGEVDLDPAVGIARAHDVIAARSLYSPGRNPLTSRVGIPSVPSMMAFPAAKYSQCPGQLSNRQ